MSPVYQRAHNQPQTVFLTLLEPISANFGPYQINKTDSSSETVTLSVAKCKGIGRDIFVTVYGPLDTWYFEVTPQTSKDFKLGFGLGGELSFSRQLSQSKASSYCYR